MCEHSKFWIKQLVTIRFDPKPIQLYEIFEYLFNRNTYKKGLCLSKKMGMPAAMVLTWLFLKSLYLATAAHQVLEKFKTLPTTQTTNRVPQHCWNYFNKYLLMVTYENGENYLIQNFA